MCGRFVQDLTDQALEALCARIAGAAPTELMKAWKPRWNVTPTARVPMLSVWRDRIHLGMGHWGWKLSQGFHTNARAETVFDLMTWGSAIGQARCVIPATAYYEWQETEHGKMPWAFRPKDGSQLWLAGMYHDRWHGNERIRDFCLITRPSVATAWCHDRMPVHLHELTVKEWLGLLPRDRVSDLLGCSDADFTWHRVNQSMNSGRTEGPEVFAPV